MKKFFNLSTIIMTAVLVAAAVLFLWTGNYAAAIMSLVALSYECVTRRSELLVADGLDLLEMYKKITGDLTSHRDKLLDENKALGERVAQLLEESAKVPGNAPEKEPVKLPEPQPVQTAKPQSRKRAKSKRPIQDIKESLKEISPKKEAE